MNKLFFQWNVVSAAIGMGICLSVFALANHSVNIVYADCGNTVRSNSPCLSQILSCSPVQGLCPSIGQESHPGNFKCDQPKSGVTCIGTGKFAPCYNKFGCRVKTVGAGCETNPDAEVEAGSQETLKETNCAG